MEYVSLGIITTTNQSKRYANGAKVFLYNPQTHDRTELTVAKYRKNGPFDFLKVEELNTPEEIKSLKGYEIHAIKDDIELEKGQYYYSDLKGCEVYDQEGKLLGKVKEVEEFPAQLTLRVARDKKPDFFVPFIEQFIKAVDIKNKRILIEKIEGLL